MIYKILLQNNDLFMIDCFFYNVIFSLLYLIYKVRNYILIAKEKYKLY